MEDLSVRPDLTIPAHELTETASRSGGPGGQHVNKTSTRVTLRWSVRDSGALTPAMRERLTAKLRLTEDGDLLVHADDSRSQLRNREIARERLAEIVREALVIPRKRVATKPSAGVHRRRVEEKRARSAIKSGRNKPGRDD